MPNPLSDVIFPRYLYHCFLHFHVLLSATKQCTANEKHPWEHHWSPSVFQSYTHVVQVCSLSSVFRNYISAASGPQAWLRNTVGSPGGSEVKNLPVNAGDTGDMGSILGSGRSSGNGNLLQYCCLGNSMDRGAWWAIVHGVMKSWRRLSNWDQERILAVLWRTQKCPDA